MSAASCHASEREIKMPAESPRFNVEPLFRQVRGLILQRISDGTWKPGSQLPNEFELSSELQVSIGTIRKALDALEAEHVLLRRQGRGTFVSDQTTNEARMRFVSFRDNQDQAFDADIVGLRSDHGEATEVERQQLALPGQAPVLRVSRFYRRADKPIMLETAVLPLSFFPKPSAVPMNYNIHVLAQAHGILIQSLEERVRAKLASSMECSILGLPDGSPVLSIERIAHAIDGRRVEWCRCAFNTQDAYYISRRP